MTLPIPPSPLLPAAIIRSRQTVRRLGWRPDLPDHRDYRFSRGTFSALFATPLPTRTRNYLGHTAIPVYDQGDLGSCTANAALRAFRIAIRRTIGGLHDFDGARLAHYYWTRALEGTEAWDAGATIRDAVKVLTKVGIAPDTIWPYDVTRFAIAPSEAVVTAAARRARVTYLRVDQDATSIKQAVAARHPVVFGMSVFGSTMRGLENTGLVPYPGTAESVLGGHALVIEDYDDVNFAEPMYLVANSWGRDVGLGATGSAALRAQMGAMYDVGALGGYVLIPQRVLHDPDIADDFWTITAAS